MVNKQMFFKALGICLLMITFVETNASAQESQYEFLRGTLITAKTFTVEVFEAMPEQDYSFKPTEDVRTFAAQAYHIAYSIEWFHNQLKGTPVQWSPGDEDSMNKEELVAYVTEQFDAMTETVMKADVNGQFTAGVIGVLRHNSHHRGQMVTYLRTNGITPPSYK